MDNLLNIDEISEVLKLSKATLYQYVRSKKIPHIKIGSRVLFSLSDIKNWDKERKENDNYYKAKIPRDVDISKDNIKRITNNLLRLPHRQANIIRHKLGIGNCEILTYKALGERYNITGARVREIMYAGLRKVKEIIERDRIRKKNNKMMLYFKTK